MAKFPAPPIRTPFIGNPPKAKLGGSEMRGAGEFSNTNVPAYAWTQWFQSVTNSLSIPAAPATSTSAGIPNQLAQDGNFLYVCVAKNSWKRVALSAF
jgi:hypothetical protein